MNTCKVNFSICFLLFVMLSCSETVIAGVVVELGGHFGGSELVTEPDTNGDQYIINAGERLSFAIGGAKQYTPAIEGQFSLGIKSDVIEGRDSELSWVRYPVNGLLFYRTETFRLGLGLTYHFSPELSGSGIAGNISQSYDDALGALFEMDFHITSGFMWGLRYTRIEYEPADGGTVLDGESVGLLLIVKL